MTLIASHDMGDSNSKHAPLPLDFIIVGGGLAGLATAHALASSGHRVRVYDKSQGTSTWSAGVRIPPNGMLVLMKWGVADKIKAKSVKCTSTEFVDMQTGERIGVLEWREEVMKELGAPFYLIHHSDLHDILRELAVSSGAELHFNTPVAAVRPCSGGEINGSSRGDNREQEKPSVTLVNGQKLYADVIIGADGPRSMVRGVVNEDEPPEGPSQMTIYSGMIPVSTMEKNAHMRSIVQDIGHPHWLGDGVLAMTYPIRSGKEYTASFWIPEPIPKGAPQGWDMPLPARTLKYPTTIEPRIVELLSHMTTLTRVTRVAREHAEDWVDETERIVLVGEAAHPKGPCGMPVISAVIEDAAILGVLFSRIRSHEQIAPLLYGYQDLRQARIKVICDLEEANHYILMLPPSEERDFRNDAWKRMKKAAEARGDAEIEEGELERQFAEICEVWGYDAVDAAEDWWVHWGMLRERALGLGGGGVLDGMQMSSSVSELEFTGSP